MSQSSELASGQGFTYEGNVTAYYLAALLAEAYAPGIDDRTVVRVSVQQRNFGEPLDDVIIDFEDTSKSPARLSLQVKSSLTISEAITNKNFRDIIRDSWATLNKPDFRINVDRYGAAVGKISSAKAQTLKSLCELARNSLTAGDFDARFVKGGSTGANINKVKNDVVTLLETTKGQPCTSEEVHLFLGHFVLVQFDFLNEGATDPPIAINLIRDCLTPDEVAKAPLVWSKTVQLARSSAGSSGQFDRTRLVRLISPVARLRGAASFRLDLDRLTELAKSHANLIPDDIGGTKLDRPSLLEDLDAKLATARLVQIRGLPGSGKSVVVRQAVRRALECGPVIFLKAEQLDGVNWISYATSQGLSGATLEKLMVEVAATGTPTLFIDAIDRIDKKHQPIIIEVVHTIVKSPLLDNWRVVVSLRDTGIEVLRNWLGEYLDAMHIQMLNVVQLSDEEAEALAKDKPHLMPLLFGSTQVREIVRRPFFAKVLNQSYEADPNVPTFSPQSEVDLIDNWWWRGGYNETGQSAIERQRALIDLARIRGHQLNQPIGFEQLTSVTRINDLISDGILQHDRKGISVRFAHDIFFEWAFFHVLAARGPQWMEAIKSCGEPPALARAVELASQWEYAQRTNWSTYLTQTEGSDVRSQWLRAWLTAPLGTARFEIDEDQFAKIVFADDFRLFRKTLVWFQAEKTTPNPNILTGTLPWEQRQRIADLLGWPSDFAVWRRLINFILQHLSIIPQRLYPEIVEIFGVWQNAFASFQNPTSKTLLQQCSTWLANIDAIDLDDRSDKNSTFWQEIPGLSSLKNSLRELLLMSSQSEPSFAAELLRRATNSNRIKDDEFHDIIAWSPILAQSLPRSVVELSLKFLRKELPDEQVAREKQEYDKCVEWRKSVMAKPEDDRTHQEKNAFSSAILSQSFGGFSDFDWQRLSIHNNFRGFRPPSPLREPFYSLFRSSPDEALRLLRELCNHAITAWRQLHRHSHNRGGTPIPLKLTFPWGTQIFWGTDREYLWFRSIWAPYAIGCGFMALEDWCFTEIENINFDELIRKIVEGNECIAILGIASMLALHTETVSATTLPLFTSQRLLAADQNRMVQDFSSAINLIGFMSSADNPHIEAIQTANARPVRKTQLFWMVPGFVFSSEPFRERAREAILNFKNDLPYHYEEQRDNSDVKQFLSDQALKFAELADPKNYQAYRTEEDSDQIAIVHVSPSSTEPENVAKTKEAAEHLRDSSLWTWATKSFEEETLNNTYTIEDAIMIAKETDACDLFENSINGNELVQLGMRRGVVAATAAMVLNFREGRKQEDLVWARDVLTRAILLPEKFDMTHMPESVIPWHQGIYVACGLAADLREHTATCGTANDLLRLVAHPLEIVSLAALEEACNLWSVDSKLTWASLHLALSLCHTPSLPLDQLREHSETLHTPSEAQAVIDSAIAFYQNGSGWPFLPLPPPAWVKIEPREKPHVPRFYGDYDWDDLIDPGEIWSEPDVFWRSKYAAEILQRIPFDKVLNSSAKSVLLDFLAGVLDWTSLKIAPPWMKPGRRDRSSTDYFDWRFALGSQLGHVAGLIPLADFQTRFLDPILDLEGDNCWGLLSPLASNYICTYVYNSPTVPCDAVAMLELCLERLLQDTAFDRDNYRYGKFIGSCQPELVRTLMFVSVERAELAARYANGNWSEISRILPLIDRFIRAGGWAASVMDPYLTLCERAKADYPAEDFADQVLAIISEGPANLKGWHGKSIPARTAVLVQYFAHREAPMPLTLAHNLLRILDILVDMGDRRSAALQLGEAFREIRLPS